VRIVAFDPGLHHFVWTSTSWSDDGALQGVEQVGLLERKKPLRKGLDAVTDTVKMLTSCDIASLFPQEPYDRFEVVLVETQHFKARNVRKEDIRDLAMVTGALAAALGREIQWAPTGQGGWSTTKKDIRRERLIQYYLPDADLSKEHFDSVLVGHKRITKRQYHDAIDTVGMALWHARGRPRQGV